MQMAVIEAARNLGGIEGAGSTELGATPHGQRFGPRGAQRGEMLAGVALQREHTDACAHGRPGVKSRE